MAEIKEIDECLLKDEKVLWQGKPKSGIVLRTNDIWFIPFSILWASIAFYAEYSILRMEAPLFMLLFGLPFVVIGLHLTIGRFIVDAMQRKHTIYALTNIGAIIVKGRYVTRISSKEIGSLSPILLKEINNEIGSIEFGADPWQYYYWDGIYVPGFHRVPKFEMIANARNVFNQIMDFKKAQNQRRPT